MATKRDIRAVRKVLYDDRRVEKITTETDSIVTLMNLDPGQAIPSDDPRVSPGTGPLWYIPNTGAISPAVREAADRCDRIARIFNAMAREIAGLDIDRSDRRRIRDALKQVGKAWTKRGALWRDKGRPTSTELREIVDHEKAAGELFKRVDAYLEVNIK
jgi:hypothetical protein